MNTVLTCVREWRILHLPISEGMVNTVPTCLRGNGEHEHVDKGQNQHRQHHGQHQQGRTSPESDLVDDIGKFCAALRDDFSPRPGGPQLPLPVCDKRVQIYGRDKWLDVDCLDCISTPNEHLPLAGLGGRQDGNGMTVSREFTSKAITKPNLDRRIVTVLFCFVSPTSKQNTLQNFDDLATIGLNRPHQYTKLCVICMSRRWVFPSILSPVLVSLK